MAMEAACVNGDYRRSSGSRPGFFMVDFHIEAASFHENQGLRCYFDSPCRVLKTPEKANNICKICVLGAAHRDSSSLRINYHMSVLTSFRAGRSYRSGDTNQVVPDAAQKG